MFWTALNWRSSFQVWLLMSPSLFPFIFFRAEETYIHSISYSCFTLINWERRKKGVQFVYTLRAETGSHSATIY